MTVQDMATLRDAPQDRQVILSLAAVTGLAMLVRLVYVVLIAGSSLLSPWGPSDAFDYHEIAANLLAGHGFSRDNTREKEVGDSRLPLFTGDGFTGDKTPTAYRPPLYPSFMALTYAVAGRNSFLAIRIAQAVLSGIGVFLVGLIAYSLSRSQAVGVLAALLIAVNPLQVYFTGELLTETLFSFLILLTLYFVTRPPITLAGVALFGLVLGLASLARSTALTLIPICLVALAVQRRPVGSASWRPLLTPGFVFLVGVGVVVMPWVARNTLLFGEVTSVSTNSGVNLALGISREWTETIGVPDLSLIDAVPVTPHTNEAEWNNSLRAMAWDRIRQHPGRFLRLFVRKWLHFFSPVLSDQHRLLFRVIGMASFLPLLVGTLLWPMVCWKRREVHAKTAYILISAAVLVFSLAHSVYITNVRFRVPIGEPAFTVFAADVFWVALTAIAASWSRVARRS